MDSVDFHIKAAELHLRFVKEKTDSIHIHDTTEEILTRLEYLRTSDHIDLSEVE